MKCLCKHNRDWPVSGWLKLLIKCLYYVKVPNRTNVTSNNGLCYCSVTLDRRRWKLNPILRAYFQLGCNKKVLHHKRGTTTSYFRHLSFASKKQNHWVCFFLFWVIFIHFERLLRLRRRLRGRWNHLFCPFSHLLLLRRRRCRHVVFCGFERQLWTPAMSPCRGLYGSDGKPAVVMHAGKWRYVTFRTAQLK